MQGESATPTSSNDVFHIDITVKEARNLPKRIREHLFIKKPPQYLVSVTCDKVTRRTRDESRDEGKAVWNEKLGGFSSTRSSSIEFRIYEVYVKSNGRTETLLSQYTTSVESLRASGWRDHTLEMSYRLHLYIPDRQMLLDISLTPQVVLPLSSASSTSNVTTTTLPLIEDALYGMESAPRLVTIAVEGAERASNAIELITAQYDTWAPLLQNIKVVVDAIDKASQECFAVHQYATIAWAVFSVIPKTVSQQIERDLRVKGLLDDLSGAFKTLGEAQDLQERCADPQQEEIISRLFQQASECGSFIESYAENTNFWKRLAKNAVNGVDKVVEQYRSAISGLRRDFLERTTVTTKICVIRASERIESLLRKINQIDAMLLLKDLPYGEGTRFDPEKRCLPETRTGFLDEIEAWVANPESPQMLVLFGQVGTGKSTIASEISKRFEDLDQLISSFVFDHNVPRPAYLPITTLARDLCDHYTPFQAALIELIRRNASFSVGTRDPATLFERLLVAELGKFDFVGNPLIVIDALDRCDEKQRASLVSTLSQKVSKLPANFRILLTARPEKDLEDAFRDAASVRIMRMDDEQFAADTQSDILTFVRSRLAPYLPDSDCQRIARTTDNLFQWASVACDFIAKPPPGKLQLDCVKLVLNSQIHDAQKQLDQLYRSVLHSLFPTIAEDQDIRSSFQLVMGFILALFESPSQDFLQDLNPFLPLPMYISKDRIQAVIGGMGSLLRNVNLDQSASPIAPLHASFRDFLTSRSRSGPFFVDLADTHLVLTQTCFNILFDRVEGLRFNICCLQTSYLANADIPDLKSRIKQHVSRILLYACRFWDDHLSKVPFTEKLIHSILTLFRERLLFWFEALSVTGSLHLAMPALSALRSWLAKPSDEANLSLPKWLENPSHEVNIAKFLRLYAYMIDSVFFLRSFGPIMAHSVPHIYLSALSFAPSSSLISTRYREIFGRAPTVLRRQSTAWPRLQMTISAPLERILSCSFSPKGDLIVSASSDGTLSLWDAITGESVLDPFKGHVGRVCTVAFSPQGDRIISGSADRTLRMWETVSGLALLKPFTGHTSSINSVSFSPDGQRIASGSNDKSIRLWDATTGEQIGAPILGHTGAVYSVAFSPNNALIASASADSTVRLWNAITRASTGGGFKRHTAAVNSIAFYPNSSLIASASDDATVYVWDAATCEVVAGPFRHMDAVTSVSFFPSGDFFVSGTRDKTIEIWGMKTHKRATLPLLGHTEPVICLSLSPDGDRVASAGEDGTIRVWDVTPRRVFSKLSEQRVCHFAFSPSHNLIACSTIRWPHDIWLWDISMDEEGQRLKQHVFDTSLRLITFSPDGSPLAMDSTDIVAWDINTGKIAGEVLRGRDINNWLASEEAPKVAFSPDRTLLAGSDSSQCVIYLWNAEAGTTIGKPMEGHEDYICFLAFSLDGRTLISASADGTLRIWDVSTCEEISEPLRGHTDAILCAALSPVGDRIASGSDDCTVRVWSTETGQAIAGPFRGHSDGVSSIAFSTAGSRLCTGSYDRSVCAWDATTGDMIGGPFAGHLAEVTQIAFTRDGHNIVSASSDGIVRITKLAAADPSPQVQALELGALGDDGWIRGTEGELLLWVPESLRAGFCRPSTVRVLGAIETKIDFTTLIYGDRWAECYTP